MRLISPIPRSEIDVSRLMYNVMDSILIFFKWCRVCGMCGGGCVGCEVWGVGCGVWGVGCGVWGVGCGVWLCHIKVTGWLS